MRRKLKPTVKAHINFVRTRVRIQRGDVVRIYDWTPSSFMRLVKITDQCVHISPHHFNWMINNK